MWCLMSVIHKKSLLPPVSTWKYVSLFSNINYTNITVWNISCYILLHSVLRQIIAKLTAGKDLPLLLKWKYVEFRCLYRMWFGFRQLLCSKRFHVSNEQVSQLRTALFWAVTLLVMVIPYRRFGQPMDPIYRGQVQIVRQTNLRSYDSIRGLCSMEL